MIRIATEIDAPLIRTLLADLDNPPYETEESLLAYLSEDVVLVDDEAGSVCSIVRNDRLDMLRVRWLLPEGRSRGRLGPLLGAALVAAAKRWPDMLDKRIEADFSQGKDAHFQPDGGRGACLAWQEFFGRLRGLKPHVTQSELHADRRWVIWWTLRQARDKIARVVARG